MDLEISILSFEELSTRELYQLLRLRSVVFVVEQDCVYQDLDNKDMKALHVLGKLDGEIVAYARIFDRGDYFQTACIGRVVVDPSHRKMAWGHAIVAAAIKGIKTFYDQDAITISAQLYLKAFYESHGFVQSSEGYLEDGLPHIEMKKED